MYGWHGVALHVDLANKKIKEMPIPRDYLVDYIGGEGLGVADWGGGRVGGS